MPIFVMADIRVTYLAKVLGAYLNEVKNISNESNMWTSEIHSFAASWLCIYS